MIKPVIPLNQSVNSLHLDARTASNFAITAAIFIATPIRGENVFPKSETRSILIHCLSLYFESSFQIITDLKLENLFIFGLAGRMDNVLGLCVCIYAWFVRRVQERTNSS